MPSRTVSVFGLAAAVACLLVATRLYPGGYDWNRDMISTLLRGPVTPARIPAIAGVLIFCASIALVFSRLAQLTVFARDAKLIRIAGVGSMVYGAITVTPMHDLMVTISLLFFVTAVIALMRSLYACRETVLFVSGCACFAVLVTNATVYYTGRFVHLLPWGQRISFALFAIWLVVLDWRLPGSQGNQAA